MQILPDVHNTDHSQTISRKGLEQPPGLRPLSNLSSNSANTEGSRSSFADQTLRTLAALDPSLDITFLLAPSQSSQHGGIELALGKASESEALTLGQPEVQYVSTEQQGNSRQNELLRLERRAQEELL